MMRLSELIWTSHRGRFSPSAAMSGAARWRAVLGGALASWATAALTHS
jgi:hypothetical protein